jgi:hypothetical protein
VLAPPQIVQKSIKKSFDGRSNANDATAEISPCPAPTPCLFRMPAVAVTHLHIIAVLKFITHCCYSTRIHGLVVRVDRCWDRLLLASWYVSLQYSFVYVNPFIVLWGKRILLKTTHSCLADSCSSWRNLRSDRCQVKGLQQCRLFLSTN